MADGAVVHYHEPPPPSVRHRMLRERHQTKPQRSRPPTELHQALPSASKSSSVKLFRLMARWFTTTNHHRHQFGIGCSVNNNKLICAPVGRVRDSIMVLILSLGDNNHYRFPLPSVLRMRAGSLVPRSALRPDVASAPPNCGVPPPAALPAAAPSALKGTIVNRQ